MSPRPTILCVDDDPAVLNQLSAQISRRFGSTHQVECTQSAEEALALLDETAAQGGDVQLVICDQAMPGMKGDRFLEAVSRRQPEVMKILLTGQAGLENAIYAINNAGLHRYVEKPWEAADLVMAVENLLTQHRLKREVALHQQRLERRNRELQALHEVGLRLGSASDPSRALALLTETARRLYGRPLAVLARTAPDRPANWWLLPPSEVKNSAAAQLEASLKSGSTEPLQLPEGTAAVPLSHAGALFGWLLLLDARDAPPDTIDLLFILASQAAASLSNLRHVEARIESERLTTVGRMIASVVHDFKNPMTAIKGYAGMVEEFELEPERRRECARLIIEEADRIAAMAEEILEFTRGQTARLHPAGVGVREIADKLRRLTAPEFEEKQLHFVDDLRYAGEAYVDVDRLKRALLNIVGNAVDAMPAGGTLTFSSRIVNGRLEIGLADTGHGIPEEALPRVFEPFFTHGKSHGMGLGLAITRRIVEEHGGQIRVESRPGQGTTFTLSLPLPPGR